MACVKIDMKARNIIFSLLSTAAFGADHTLEQLTHGNGIARVKTLAANDSKPWYKSPTKLLAAGAVVAGVIVGSLDQYTRFPCEISWSDWGGKAPNTIEVGVYPVTFFVNRADTEGGKYQNVDLDVVYTWFFRDVAECSPPVITRSSLRIKSQPALHLRLMYVAQRLVFG